MKKIVVVLSGGLDSTVLMEWHRDRGDDVYPITINYGQRHVREIGAATASANEAGLLLLVVDLRDLRKVLAGSSQTSSDIPVPEGHYAEANMKQTVVPNRNMILLSVAIGYAVSIKADAVSYAAHAGDHAIYPDCRPEFVDRMNEAAALCDWHKVEILRPFIHNTKAGIVAIGAKLMVDFCFTYSCYVGGPNHCGRCGTCIERKEAFELAKVPDPTEYEDPRPAHAILSELGTKVIH